ncbi:Fic family protein [Alkalimonas delamerensis]|uniref:protein adenylyltransferase n=1 Tax=Alkalimonas delamerensis TaxID=265981 RepID=A0ABT9GPV8_9GAMM|nr:Fic family protein [Alkalimonas delamerensis]MDP4529003.1 Fic family protein [Alkalimonas delamerensis]
MIDKYGAGNDSYCYENTSVLINLLDLTSEAELAAAEVAFTTYRLAAFKPDFENLTFSYLCDIHRHLFQDLYEWAGQIRTVDISKQSTRFCHVRFIENEANKCFKYLEKRTIYKTMIKQPLSIIWHTSFVR